MGQGTTAQAGRSRLAGSGWVHVLVKHRRVGRSREHEVDRRLGLADGQRAVRVADQWRIDPTPP